MSDDDEFDDVVRAIVSDDGGDVDDEQDDVVQAIVYDDDEVDDVV